MIQEKIRAQIKDAMRAKDELRKEVLRGILTAFVNEVVAERRTPQEILEDDTHLGFNKNKRLSCCITIEPWMNEMIVRIPIEMPKNDVDIIRV